MKKADYTNVDAYIADQREENRPLLEQLRKTIVSTVPGAEEVIRWGAPFYKYHGFLAGFAAYKQHVRFGIVGAEVDDAMREALAARGYTVLERAVQIKYGQPVPTAEISQILRERAKALDAENELPQQ